MIIVAIDARPDSRVALVGRIKAGIDQAGLQDVVIVECDPQSFLHDHRSASADVVILGPSTYATLGDIIDTVKRTVDAKLAIVLDNEVYSTKGIALRKRYGAKVMAINDVAQLASFLLDCMAESLGGASGDTTVIACAQLKGGVGNTTVTCALGSCYARNGLVSLIVDLDDVNPQATAWARATPNQREVTAEFLRAGKVEKNRLGEMLAPVAGYESKLFIAPQPLMYNEGFHFKADVLESSPSSDEFISELIRVVSGDFDVVLFDLGRSWGVATFAVLKEADWILLVTDDDGMSVRQTVDNLDRLSKESDDASEFDFTKWNIILNGYTGALLTPEVVAGEITNARLLPDEASLFVIPFCPDGRMWGGKGESFYDLASQDTKKSIEETAKALKYFEGEEQDKPKTSVIQKIKNLI